MRIWAVVRAVALVYGTCLENPGICLARDADGRVGLSVLQKYVVTGIIFLYQRILQKQRILFGVDNGIGYVVNLAYQYLRLESVDLPVEIGTYPALKVFGLAYVDNDPVCIVILIRSGLLWHRCHNGFETLKTVSG